MMKLGSASARQDYGESARLPLFLTDLEDFMYATPAGTVFLVNYEEKIYGLTCHHVLGDKELHRLVITDQKAALKGGKLAPISGVYYTKPNTETTEGTDIVDVCVIDFGDDLDANFFHGSAYRLHQTTAVTSQRGDHLEVSGVLAEKVDITPPDIQAGYCCLQFLDDGPHRYDPFLRQAKAKYRNVNFKALRANWWVKTEVKKQEVLVLQAFSEFLCA